jgi:hypothetical protein
VRCGQIARLDKHLRIAGCGKTHLAVALAALAVEAGCGRYFTTADSPRRY